MDIQRFRQKASRFGWRAAITAGAIRRLKNGLGIHLVRVRVRSLRPMLPELNLDPELTLSLLDRLTLLKACQDPTLSLPRDFVESALARGDVCFGVLHKDRLVAYAWRTFASAPYVNDLWVRINPPYRYGYKAFTHPEYRGQRLNTAVDLYSDKHFLERGYLQDIAYVDADNLESLAAGKFKGSTNVGWAGHLRWFGRSIPFHSAGVKRTNFAFVKCDKRRSPPDNR